MLLNNILPPLKRDTVTTEETPMIKNFSITMLAFLHVNSLWGADPKTAAFKAG
jgi:hypothetical protein